MLLPMLLLLATELASFGCCGGHRIIPRADVAAWRHGRVAAATATTTTTTIAGAAASATSPSPTAARHADAEAVLGESKRMVPQGSNPLHN